MRRTTRSTGPRVRLGDRDGVVAVAWAPDVDVARAVRARVEAQVRARLAGEGRWLYAGVIAGPGCSRPDAVAELDETVARMAPGEQLDHARKVREKLTGAGGYVVVVTARPAP